LKVLLIHTHYLQKGGEDVVFASEQELLSGSEQVRSLAFRNRPGWRGGLQFLFSIWNVGASRELRKAIDQFQPDIVHIHNLHFAIGPIAISTIKKFNIPVVLTIHNYRLLCPSATLLHGNKLFTDSVYASFPWSAIRNKVYRNSYIQTFWLAVVTWFHRWIHTWHKVDAYIVLTDFAKTLFASSTVRIPEDKFVVKPNFVWQQAFDGEKRRSHFLFVGRLSEEKGIKLILEAFQKTDFEIYIVGDGPLRELVRTRCSENKNIHYMGNLSRADVLNELRKCSALIFPSIWYEGMPMTIIEAFSMGTPVIASNIGAMASMIRHGHTGIHFTAGSVLSLKEQLSNWRGLSEGEKNKYADRTLNNYRALYTPEVNKEQLVNIYRNAIRHNN
jgi:glycosyltransferase involved in cell wall biosynthesis